MIHKIITLLFIIALTLGGLHAAIPAQESEENAKQKIMELSSAFILSRAIHTAAMLKIADEFVLGPVSCFDVASKLNLNADALYRLMRLLAQNDIFQEMDPQVFALTELARPLLSQDKDSLHAWLAYHDGYAKRWQAYGNMDYSIKTGQPAFNQLFGNGYFDEILQEQDGAAHFDEGMRNLSSDEEAMIAQVYDFSPFTTIVDVGGGKGGMLSQILTTYSQVCGVLYDLPQTAQQAQSYFAQKNLSGRTVCKGGSFFDVIPADGDCYILKRILHDWNDEQCTTILSNCSKAMGPHARLLIIEAIVAAGNAKDFVKDVDMAMLVLFGGKERTLAEWNVLLEAAHLQLIGITKTPSMLSIIEVKRLS